MLLINLLDNQFEKVAAPHLVYKPGRMGLWTTP